MSDVEELFTQTREALLRYFLRRVDDPADAADLLGEVFLVAWRRRRRIPDDDGRLWLFGVARNVLAAHRRGGRRQRALAERLRHQLVEQYQPDPSEVYVRRLLDQVPAKDRELLELMVFDALTATEAATVLGRSPEAVRVQLHRARPQLKRLLDEPVAHR